MQRKAAFTAAMTLVFAAVFSINTAATSLWTDAAARPYGDHRASKVGDVVTVIIRESASGSQSSSMNANSEQSLELTLRTFISQLATLLGTSVPDVGNLTTGTSTSQSASGRTGQSGELIGRITAVVKEIGPNGVMTLEGSKSIEINGEVQTLVITGKVRPRDITADNTVDSIYLADVHISFNGSGPISEEHKPGLITRFLMWLF